MLGVSIQTCELAAYLNTDMRASVTYASTSSV